MSNISAAMIPNALPWCWEQVAGDKRTKVTTVILSLLLIVVVSWLRKKSSQKKIPLPPGPWGLPLLGNLPFLTPDLHRCFGKLSLKYGPIMKIQLGGRLCVVFSSPEFAKVILKDSDASFADRDVPAAALVGTYGGLDIGFAPYGDHWRMLRKVCVKELLSHGSLEALYGLRRREVRDMVSNIYSQIGNSTDVGHYVLLAMVNIITSMIWGNTLHGENKARVTAKFREAGQKMMDLIGEANISDFYPVLGRFDIQGKERQMREVLKWFDQIYESVFEEHRKNQSKEGEENKDFIQVLLQLIEDTKDENTPLTVTHLKALFVDMLIAGTKPTAAAVEWAMARLLLHPEMIKKAQAELDHVVGLNNVIEESHLSQLPYLDAIIKESLRLHPQAPLLLPRVSKESHVIGGYFIPAGAKVCVNAWAIHRDPKYWNDPLEFQPERFLNSPMDWDYSGNDFRYLPFGSGRRICAGVPLTQRLASYLLGSLLHSFNWELPKGGCIDLSERFGLELKKEIPLVAIPTPRLSDARLYG